MNIELDVPFKPIKEGLEPEDYASQNSSHYAGSLTKKLHHEIKVKNISENAASSNNQRILVVNLLCIDDLENAREKSNPKISKFSQKHEEDKHKPQPKQNQSVKKKL